MHTTFQQLSQRYRSLQPLRRRVSLLTRPLQRLSPQELSERNKRMKRAIDLSLKHTYLAHDVQKIEGTPYRSYLEIEEVRCSFCLPCAPVSSVLCHLSLRRLLRCDCL